jgi:hypothetical protein
VCYVYERKEEALLHVATSTVAILEALDLHERDIYNKRQGTTKKIIYGRR